MTSKQDILSEINKNDSAHIDRLVRAYSNNTKLHDDPTFRALSHLRNEIYRKQGFCGPWEDVVERMKAYTRLLGEKM